jgi:hypothetical protein
MAREVFHQRCSQIIEFPPELLAYQRWLDAQRADAQGLGKHGLDKQSAKPRARDYLFTEQQPRFEPRKDDVVVATPGLRVESKKGGCLLRSEDPVAVIDLPGVTKAEAEKLLVSIDGTRCLLEVKWAAGVEQPVFSKFLRATFGLVVFAPKSIGAMESAISGTEITRFPCPPYAIERPYWCNMVDVRTHAQQTTNWLDNPQSFERRLRELHVLALMGQSLNSFYKPASPVSDEVVAPGVFYLDAARLREGVTGTLFLDGPRVNVSFVGGEGYHRALYASLGDEQAMESDRSFEFDGLSWGRIVRARSERDDHAGCWFCPPRPITDGHFEVMFDAFRNAHQAVGRGNAKEAVRNVARFHQVFVRLHPFHCANQSLAMNLANIVLQQACGAGSPHHLLDHFALRLSESAYERVFARAVQAYAVRSTNPAQRLATLLEKKNQSFGVIARLGNAKTEQEASAIMRESPEAARAALLVDDIEDASVV